VIDATSTVPEVDRLPRAEVDGLPLVAAGGVGIKQAVRAVRAEYARVVQRRPRVEDIHEVAAGMPHVTVLYGPRDNPIYQVGGKSFIFFRTPRPDAIDPQTGERYPDVIVFWVASEADKQALIQDESTAFFTTPHSTGIRPCCSVLPGSAN
jgi:hypothetical protein